MGIYLAGSREERRSNVFHSQDPTTAADKVKPSVTALIILNTLYTNSQWSYTPFLPVLCVSCSKLLYGHDLLMAHVCFGVYTCSDGRSSSICSPATGAHTDIIAQILTVSCPVCSQRGDLHRDKCVRVCVRETKRGGVKDKEVLI